MTIYVIEADNRYHDSGGSWIVCSFINKNCAILFSERLNNLVKELEKPKRLRLSLEKIRKQIKSLDINFTPEDPPTYYVTETELLGVYK